MTHFLPPEAQPPHTSPSLPSCRRCLRSRRLRSSSRTCLRCALCCVVLCLLFIAAMGAGQAVNLRVAAGTAAAGLPLVVEELIAGGRGYALVSPGAPAGGVQRWRIRVTWEGLYRLGCDQLAVLLGAAAPDLPALQLARSIGGTEPAAQVALREVDADGDRRCDPTDGDAVEFWGEAGRGRYDEGAYYWLSVGAAAGLRMVQRPSASSGLPDPPVWRTQRFEQNRYYRSSVGGQDPGGVSQDHWFWTFLAFGSSTFGSVQEFPFTVGAVAVGNTRPAAAAFVSVTLASLDGSHRVQVSLNGVGIGDLIWQGSGTYEGVLAVPPGALQSGENRLALALTAVPAPVLPVLVDHFAVKYPLPPPLDLGGQSTPEALPLVFHIEPGSWQLQFSAVPAPTTLLDVSDPLRPVEVVAPSCTEAGCVWGIAATQEGIYAAVADGARLAVDSIEEDVPSQWRTAANGADYILISHRSLWPAAQLLAAHRRSQGLRVALVDVQDIYDEFNGGQVDAEAIRSFLAYAWSNWQPPAPTYVLLLGDGTFDPRGYCASPGTCPELVTASNSTLIPPYLASADPWLGETAADNRYVALDPASSLPWLAIGRLPANDLGEARAMVDKIVAYESGLPASANARTVDIALVSDNTYAAGGALDPAGNFWQASDAAFDAIRQAAATNGVQLVAERFYLNVCDALRYPHCLLPDPPFSRYSDAEALKAALAGWLTSAFRPATTSLLIHYVGHGAIVGWAGQPVLLQNRDVASLGLAPRLPIVVDMSCYTGYFQFPGLQSMAEAWLSLPQHGAVAVVASSGLDLVAAHAVLDTALLSQLAGHSSMTLGQAFLSAKLAAAAAGLSQDVDTFHLFGDPAMPLWVAGAAPIEPPAPTVTAGVPTSQVPTAPPVSPPVPVTPVPGSPADDRCYLYLPWVPGGDER